MTDYYDILNIPPDASPEMITERYRRLVQMHHHDQPQPGATVIKTTEELQRISEAYQVLSDPVQRASYDQQHDLNMLPTPEHLLPKPHISPAILDFGTLKHGEVQTLIFVVSNLGGPFKSVDFKSRAAEDWFRIAHTRQIAETATIEVEVTVDTRSLVAGHNYAGQIEVHLDDVAARVNLVLQVAALSAPDFTSVPRPQPVSTPLPVRRFTLPYLPAWAVILIMAISLGLAGGALLPSLVRDRPSATSTMTPTTIPPPPTLPPGQIVFTVNENGHLMLHTAQTDGLNQQNLNTPGWSPTCSPDGRAIAFVSDRSGFLQIYSINTDGGMPTRLTDSPEEKSDPLWSPDSQWLAFIAHTPAGGVIYLVDGQGITRRTITTADMGDVQQLTWSPDGRFLAFAARSADARRVYRITAEGTDLRQLTDFETWQPAWSPDGERIAVTAEGGIYTLNADGSQRLRLTTFRAWASAWAPDGGSIAFLSDRGVPGGHPELWVMRANGQQQQRVTDTGCWGYAWSSTGQELAYLTRDMAQPSGLFLEVISMESGAQQRLAPAEGHSLSWKP